MFTSSEITKVRVKGVVEHIGVMYGTWRIERNYEVLPEQTGCCHAKRAKGLKANVKIYLTGISIPEQMKFFLFGGLIEYLFNSQNIQINIKESACDLVCAQVCTMKSKMKAQYD